VHPKRRKHCLLTSFFALSIQFRDATSFREDISGWNVTLLETAEEAFRGATTFNHNLCDWGPQLSSFINGTEIEVKDMFDGSGCIVTDDPEIPVGPFCHVCTEDNAANSTTDPAKESNFASFASTEELYQAVDEYMEAVLFSSPETSSAVQRYGLIETWDVSRLSNFSRVFDANRIAANVSFFGNIFYPSGEAGGCSLTNERLAWNMSNSIDLSAMVSFSRFKLACCLRTVLTHSL